MMLTPAIALLLGAGALVSPAGLAPAQATAPFPYRHATVVPAAQAPATPPPDGTLWVTVDDGAAVPRQSVGRAIPADGTKSLDAAYDDPTACDRVGTQRTVCWRYWQRVGDEVRIWTTYAGQSCVLIADLTGQPTRLDCAPATATATGGEQHA